MKISNKLLAIFAATSLIDAQLYAANPKISFDEDSIKIEPIH